jgi:hypothetical protein
MWPTEGSKVMEVAFVDDQVSVTGWPAWAEAGEALRATLGDADGGACCAAEMGFSPLAVSASATKPNKAAARSEWKRIDPPLVSMEHYMELEASNVRHIGARIAELHDVGYCS